MEDRVGEKAIKERKAEDRKVFLSYNPHRREYPGAGGYRVYANVIIPPNPPWKGGNRLQSPPYKGGFRGIEHENRVFNRDLCTP
jgi:hypothetical protein